MRNTIRIAVFCSYLCWSANYLQPAKAQTRHSFSHTTPTHYGGSSTTNASNGVTNYGGSSSTYSTRSTPTSSSFSLDQPKSDAPYFNARSAPSPAACFTSLVQQARATNSVSSLFPYLPQSKVDQLREAQNGYDPALAATRRAQYRTDRTMSQEAIDHLTDDPYTRELKSLKKLANKVLRIGTPEINGNQAKLSISIRSDARQQINGGKWEAYPYSTALVKMVGEGSYWKFESYNESGISSKSP